MTTDIGPQYHKDDTFKAKARLHQSRYRAEVLRLGFDRYGNCLLERDARNLANYYSGLNSRAVLRERYPKYSSLRDANMLRSEHIPFNLIAPLDCDRLLAAEILRKCLGIAVNKIILVKIEYAPEPKGNYLDDNTSFDAYIVYESHDQARCGIGFEVKYTEGAYEIGHTEKKNVDNKKSLYWEVTRNSKSFLDPDNDELGSDDLRQIWRNHLLGVAMVLRGELTTFHSVTLYPEGNSHIKNALGRYKDLLSDDCKAFVVGCTFKDFIEQIGGSELTFPPMLSRCEVESKSILPDIPYEALSVAKSLRRNVAECAMWANLVVI